MTNYEFMEENCTGTECLGCPFLCEECNCCTLQIDETQNKDECIDCIYFCEDCGACTYLDDEEDETDDDLDIRKEVFLKLSHDILDVLFQYGKELFEEE